MWIDDDDWHAQAWPDLRRTCGVPVRAPRLPGGQRRDRHVRGIEDASHDDLTRMIEVSFAGTVWSVRAAVPQLRRQGDGSDLVLVSSVAGLRGGADEAVYVGTKFAQVGLAGSLDRELREDGIPVTAI